MIYSTMIRITKLYEKNRESRNKGCNTDLFQNLCSAFILDVKGCDNSIGNDNKINLRLLFKNENNLKNENETYENYKKEIKIKNEKLNFKNIIDNSHTCLLVIIQRLAESSLPIPILSRVYPTIWLSEKLKNSSIYSKNSNLLICNQNRNSEFQDKVCVYMKTCIYVHVFMNMIIHIM
jgi:hypothetical protein